MEYSTGEHLLRHPQVLLKFTELGPGESAWWCPDQRVLLVDSRLTRAEARCAIAHELVHIERGDECHPDDVLAARQELSADRIAARRLIKPAALAEAVAAHRGDIRAAAEDLFVTTEILDVRLADLTPDEQQHIHARIDRADHVA